jgi:hypothetical protein
VARAAQATSLCQRLVSLHPYALRLYAYVLQAASRSRAPRTVRCAAGVPTTPPFAASHTRRCRQVARACSHSAFRRVASPHRSPPTACCRCPPYTLHCICTAHDAAGAVRVHTLRARCRRGRGRAARVRCAAATQAAPRRARARARVKARVRARAHRCVRRRSR